MLGLALGLALRIVAPDPDAITLAFGGDVHGELHVRWALEAGRDPFAHVAATLQRADVALVNLETTVAYGGAAESKRFVYRAHPMLLEAALGAGVDVVTVANNHAWDLGRDGFVSTLRHVEGAGLIAVGGGLDRQAAEAPALIDVRGTTVAIVGIGRVGPMLHARARDDRPGITNGFDDERMIDAVRRAGEVADVVVATVHLGREGRLCPRDDDVQFVARIQDAGATIVVGHHPHRLQPIELRDGRLAAYSIGNLVFDAREREARQSGVLTVTVRPGGEVIDYRWTPTRIVDGTPELVGGHAHDGALAALDGDRCPELDRPRPR